MVFCPKIWIVYSFSINFTDVIQEKTINPPLRK